MKNYIARGRQIGKLDIVSFTVSLDALTEIAHEYKGKKYVSFEIARLRNTDQNGKTHTMYQFIKDAQPEVSKVEEPMAETVKPKRSRKKK